MFHRYVIPKGLLELYERKNKAKTLRGQIRGLKNIIVWYEIHRKPIPTNLLVTYDRAIQWCKLTGYEV